MPHAGVQIIAEKFATLKFVLDERASRLWAAVEAHAIGRGGISRVAEATGLSRITIRAGLRELHPSTPALGRGAIAGRTRRRGGGRKPLTEHDLDLLRALEVLVDLVTRGDPMSPLRWTCKSAAKLAEELSAGGHQVSERSVNRLLHDVGYSLQSNRKTIEGGDHSDRDAQFRHINRRAKELVGQFRNGGREWQPKGQPEAVQVHDFPDPELGKAIPTVSMTWRPMPGGSAWASITIRPSSPWRRSGGGGGTRAAVSIRRRRSCWSRPTASGRTGAAADFGRWSSSAGPARSG
jgi:hypothetical protein